LISQITIGKKIALACAFLVALTVALGALTIRMIGGIEGNLHALADDSLPGVDRISTIRGQVYLIRGNLWRYLTMSDRQGKDELERENERLMREMEQTFREYEQTIFNAEDREMYSRIGPLWNRYLQFWRQAQQLDLGGRKEEAVAKYLEAIPVYGELRSSLDSLVAWNRAHGERNAKAARESVASAGFWAWVLLMGSALAGSLLAGGLVWSVNKHLRRAAADLSDGAEQVASAASQVASSSQALAQGSSEQAASLEETSASSEEVNSMARKNTENSSRAAELVTHSQQKFAQTNQLLEQMVVAMGEINAQSDKIAKIIKVIDEIAFQTNILALNAAVEAARAGEAGGRNLAKRCPQAAKDTSALIEESITKSNGGKAKVDQVAVAIRAITEESGSVKTLMDEVNLGSQEQARGIEQIGRAITQMEQVTQKTAASAEEGASAAEELTAQSEALKEIVGRLTAMVGGGEAAHARPTAGRTGSARRAALKPRRGDNRSDLSALCAAVSHRPSKDAIPMEEEFKAF
jgi:methyl-accepting chemotaxis protein